MWQLKISKGNPLKILLMQPAENFKAVLAKILGKFSKIKGKLQKKIGKIATF
jgi:hypothetical protein